MITLSQEDSTHTVTGADHQLVGNGTAPLMPIDCTPARHPLRSLLKCSVRTGCFEAAEIAGKPLASGLLGSH